MNKRNLSENLNFSLGQTLTKFNLTNYKNKNKEFSIKDHDYFYPKQFSPKKSSPSKINIRKLDISNKFWQQVPTFGTLDVEKMIKKRKQKSKSLMKIEVTSQSQKNLIEFMNPENLPKISIKNSLKSSPVKKLVQAARNEEKFRKFTQSYFKSVEKTKVTMEGKKVQKQFDQVKSFGWSVKGYLINGNLVLKAIRWVKKPHSFDKQKIQKYKKYVFNSGIQKKISEDYEQFVKEWLYLDQVLSR